MENLKDLYKVGDTIYFLYGYELLRGVVEWVGLKNIKVTTSFYRGVFKVDSSKVAKPDESVGVVYQTWKGHNSYRLEKELHDEYRKLAKQWKFQTYIWESEYGMVSEYTKLYFIK